MKRVTCLPPLIIVVISLAIAGVTEKPPMAMAGGFPCWLCHGVNFEGSDLAPRVNGTKLTDAEILKQVHNPRGVMPAFDARDWPDDATIIQYIRSLPPAGPTKTLTNPERAAALSTIAAVARIRAMAAAAADYPTMTPSPVTVATASRTPVTAPASGANEVVTTSWPRVSNVTVARPVPSLTTVALASQPAAPLDLLVLGGAVLVVGISVLWLASRR